MVQKSLKELQEEVNKERTKLNEIRKRELLNLELKKLKSRQKNDALTRVGRGLKIIGKKTAKSAGRFAKQRFEAIKEQQILENKRLKKRKKGSPAFDPFAPL